MSLPFAFSQRTWPGAGDIDDCWVVATIWAAVASGETYRPTVPKFRTAAHNPDKPGPTGGDLDQIMRAIPAMWPDAVAEEFRAKDWAGFVDMLKAGWIASLAVLSSKLPPPLQYRFYGTHQIGVGVANGLLFVMNPLMKQGDALRAIGENELKAATLTVADGWVLAVMFRPKGDVKMPSVTTTEAALAQGLLRNLGADPLKPAMVRAVVSWFRQESGNLSRVVGNNAFNIKPGAASSLATGTDDRGFLVFPHMAAGWEAVALVITAGAPAHGYGTVLTAARSNDALQFLAALARSQWSESHYGWEPGLNPRGINNHLVAVYIRLRLLFALH